MRRVASGTHLVEEGHELPGSLGAELNGVGGGGRGGGVTGSGRNWGGGLGVSSSGSMHPSGGNGDNGASGRGVPQRSATTGTLDVMGGGGGGGGGVNGDRKMS